MAKTATAEKPDEKVDKAEKVEEIRPHGITAARFGPAAEYNNVWRANVPTSVKPADTLDEQYWEHISMHLRAGDEIHVYPDNMEWQQILHVTNCGRLFAQVVQKELYDLRSKQKPITLPSKYKVEHAGAHHKWRVLRDGRMLKDGFATEALARRYAANHEDAVNR